MLDHSIAAVPDPRRLTIDSVPNVARPLIEAAQAGRDLRFALLEAVRRIGFDWFVFVRCDRTVAAKVPTCQQWGHPPDDWRRAYDERNYMAVDPRWQAMLSTTVPIVWDSADAATSDDPRLVEILVAAASFGVRSGVWLQLNQPDPGCREFFAVSSEQPLDDVRRRRALVRVMGDLWAIGVYGRHLLPEVAFVDEAAGGRHRRLSQREGECLTLVARGATSRMIAEELRISERTVNAHIERAIRKCGARNRGEALARCIAAGTIAV